MVFRGVFPSRDGRREKWDERIEERWVRKGREGGEIRGTTIRA